MDGCRRRAGWLAAGMSWTSERIGGTAVPVVDAPVVTTVMA